MRNPLSSYKVVFWDFDGVIKDSMDVKTEAFRALFAEFGKVVQDRVQAHHLAHGGISRYEKIPHYFKEFLGVELSPPEVQEYCDRFASLVREKVLASPWVPGVLDYLDEFYRRQIFFVVTGTPEDEMAWILNKLGLERFFAGSCGAPRKKKQIMTDLLTTQGYNPSDCLMVGDSLEDFKAAEALHVDFLLRETAQNRRLFSGLSCARVGDFTGWNSGSL